MSTNRVVACRWTLVSIFADLRSPRKQVEIDFKAVRVEEIDRVGEGVNEEIRALRLPDRIRADVPPDARVIDSESVVLPVVVYCSSAKRAVALAEPFREASLSQYFANEMFLKRLTCAYV